MNPTYLRFRVWLANTLDRIYEATHEPADRGDRDPDVRFFRAAVAAKRIDDARGIRYTGGAVRDASGRYATLTGLDETHHPATTLEATA